MTPKRVSPVKKSTHIVNRSLGIIIFKWFFSEVVTDLCPPRSSNPVGVILGHEEVVWGHLASDGHPFQLGGFDDLDLFFPGHVTNVDGSVVKLGQEDGGGSRPAFGVHANRTGGIL